MMAKTATPTAIVSMELTELGVGSIYICADNSEQQSAAHTLLATVTPQLRALDDACKAAAAKIQACGLRVP
jgi:hypothetical protein